MAGLKRSARRSSIGSTWFRAVVQALDSPSPSSGPPSQARSALKEVLDRVADDADVTIITRRDAADAVLMSLATFNSWQETMHLLSSPANARHLMRSKLS